MAYGVYRNLDLRIANPMMAALEGYKGVDSVIKDNEDRKIAALDRERRITREDAQETRAQAQEGRLVSGEERAQALHQQTMEEAARKRLQQKLMSAEMSLGQIQDAVAGESDPNILYQAGSKWWDNLDPDVQKALGQDFMASSNFNTPESIKQTKQAVNDFHAGMAARDKQKVIEALNVIERDRINKGGGRPGMDVTSKKIVDVKFDKNGMVAIELEVTGFDKKTKRETTYRDFMTVGRGGDPEDLIKLVDPAAVAKSVDRYGFMAVAAERIHAGMAAAGNMEAYKEYKQKGDNKKQSAALVKMLDGVDMSQGYDKALTQASALAAPLLESGDVTFTQIGAALDVKFKAHKADVDQKNKERDQEIEAAKVDATRATGTGGLKLKDVKADVESLIKSLASAQRGENMNSLILERLDKDGYAKSVEGLKNAIRDNLRLLDSQYDGAGRAIYKSQYQKGGLMYGPKTIKPTGKLPPDIKVGDVRELNGTTYRYIGDGQLEEVVQ